MGGVVLWFASLVFLAILFIYLFSNLFLTFFFFLLIFKLSQFAQY